MFPKSASYIYPNFTEQTSPFLYSADYIKPSCFVAVWNPNEQFTWMLVDCAKKRLTPILICQKISKAHAADGGDVDKEAAARNSLVVYINGENASYPWTLEACYSHLGSQIIRDFHRPYLDTGIYYICSTDQLDQSNALTPIMHKMIFEALKNILHDSCQVKSLTVPVCINVIDEEVNPLSVSTRSTINKATTLSIGVPKCPGISIEISGSCYILNCSMSTDVSNLQSTEKVHKLLSSFVIQPSCLHLYEGFPTPSYVSKSCNRREFRCKHDECISEWFLLDGERDCKHGSDEDVGPSIKRKVHIANSSIAPCQQENIANNIHYYQCEAGSCIPWHWFCDGFSDCPQGDDEKLCISTEDFTNRVRVAVQTDVHVDCTGEDAVLCEKAKVCIHKDRFGDGMPDCPHTKIIPVYQNRFHKSPLLPIVYLAEDEPMASLPSPACKENELPCAYSIQPQCFPFQRLCVYDKDFLGRLRYCHNGGHLLHCSSIDCSGWFKCPGSYCLSLSHVCDGTRDCPKGDDETDCPDKSITCPDRFRCKAGGCIQPTFVCDGINDCPYRDDELHCSMAACPEGCQCQASSVFCSKLLVDTVDCRMVKSVQIKRVRTSLAAILNGYSLVYFTMTNSDIFNIAAGLFNTSQAIVSIDLSSNYIMTIGMDPFLDLSNLRYLNISRNAMKTMNPGSLRELKMLIMLDASHNHLSLIQKDLLSGLHSLKVIYFNSNKLLEIHISTIILGSLRVLNIGDNYIWYLYIGDPDTNRVRMSSQITVVTDTYSICCMLDVGGSECVTHNKLDCICKANFKWYNLSILGIVGILLIGIGSLLVFYRIRGKVSIGNMTHFGYDGCCILMGLSTIMVGLKDSLFSSLLVSAPGSSKHVFCLLASILQYASFGLHNCMGVVHLYSLHVTSKYWTRPKAEVYKSLKNICVAFSLHLILIPVVLTVIQYALDGSVINVGHECSFFFSRSFSPWEKSMLAYLGLLQVAGFVLLLYFGRSVVRTMAESQKVISDIAGTVVTHVKTDNLMKKLINRRAPVVVLSLPLLCFVFMSVGNVGFPLDASLPVINLVFTLPYGVTMIGSFREQKLLSYVFER